MLNLSPESTLFYHVRNWAVRMCAMIEILLGEHFLFWLLLSLHCIVGYLCSVVSFPNTTPQKKSPRPLSFSAFLDTCFITIYKPAFKSSAEFCRMCLFILSPAEQRGGVGSHEWASTSGKAEHSLHSSFLLASQKFNQESLASVIKSVSILVYGGNFIFSFVYLKVFLALC